MLVATDLQDDLGEIRQRVCTRCPRWARCGPQAECGLERKLPHLLEALHEATAELSKSDAVALHARSALHGNSRLCPTEELAAGVVRVVAGVDDRRAQWECLHRRLARRSSPDRAPVAEMIRAYEEATGTDIGCD